MDNHIMHFCAPSFAKRAWLCKKAWSLFIRGLQFFTLHFAMMLQLQLVFIKICRKNRAAMKGLVAKERMN